MKKPVLVLGAGGHAKVLIDALKLSSVKVLGTIERGQEKRIFKHSAGKIRLVNGIGMAHPKDRKRQNIFDFFRQKGYRFVSVIHPSAIVAKDVRLGEGAQVMAGAVVQAGTRLGDNVIVNTRASVDHDCVIGAHAHVSPGAVLCGNVQVGEGSQVGAGAVVVQGTRIGRRVLVRANSLVKRTAKR